MGRRKKDQDVLVENPLNNVIVKAVKCSTCGKLFDVDSDEYLMIKGDIVIGNGEILDNANDSENRLSLNIVDGKLNGVTVRCRNKLCNQDIFILFENKSTAEQGKE